MATDDPNYSYLLRRIEELEQLVSANPLRSASVSRGTTEFRDNSTLLVTDSNLSVVGTATVTGWLRVIGRIVLEGLGILTVNGLIELLGRMRVSGGGGISVEGGGDIEVDGGEIRVGNVVLRDGKIYVGEGAGQIVIDSATRKILAGDVEIEFDKITVGGGDSPARLQDGALSFGTGGTVEADTSNNGVRMAVGGNQVYVGTGAASVQVGPQSILVTSSGIFTANLNVIEQSLLPESMPVGTLYVTPAGEWLRVVAG